MLYLAKPGCGRVPFPTSHLGGNAWLPQPPTPQLGVDATDRSAISISPMPAGSLRGSEMSDFGGVWEPTALSTAQPGCARRASSTWYGLAQPKMAKARFTCSVERV